MLVRLPGFRTKSEDSVGIKTVVSFQHSNGLPEDRFVNTFALITGGDHSSAGALAALHTAFFNLYNAATPTTGKALAYYLSAMIDRDPGLMSIQSYDITGLLDGSPHGSPIHATTHELVDGALGNTLPAEVALCVTLEAQGRSAQPVETPDGVDDNFVSDRPRQRYTGRIYLGPFSSVAANAATTSTVPHSDLITTAGEAFSALKTALAGIVTGGVTWKLGVWSRADASIRNVEAVSIDNAWDTQRRRGLAATTRTRRII
jgi:hypothetical protein